MASERNTFSFDTIILRRDLEWRPLSKATDVELRTKVTGGLPSMGLHGHVGHD